MVYGVGDSQDDTVISAFSISVLGRISVRTDHVHGTKYCHGYTCMLGY